MMRDYSKLHKLAVEAKEVVTDLWAVILLLILVLGGFCWAIDAVMDVMPLVLLVIFGLPGLYWGLSGVLGWIVLSKYGISTTGKCIKMHYEPLLRHGDVIPLSYEFQAHDSHGIIRTYSGELRVPSGMCNRAFSDSEIRIRYYPKYPKIRRIDWAYYRERLYWSGY